MDLEYNYLVSTASIFRSAIELRCSSDLAHLSNVEKYYTTLRSDLEIQRFNLFEMVPDRLFSEDDVAMWFLETDSLNRQRVGHYLSSNSNTSMNNQSTRRHIPRVILEKIASKICALEVASGFIDGLKLFLPVVDDNDILSCGFSKSDEKIRVLLREYVIAHFTHSSLPLLNYIAIDHVPVIIDIAISVLNVSRSLLLKERNTLYGLQSSSNTQSSMTMNTFMNEITDILSRQSNVYQPVLSLPTKTINDLYSDACRTVSSLIQQLSQVQAQGGPWNNKENDAILNFLRLPLTTNIPPSYLFFSKPRVQGHVMACLSGTTSHRGDGNSIRQGSSRTGVFPTQHSHRESAGNESSIYLYAKLSHDAVYLFDPLLPDTDRAATDDQQMVVHTSSELSLPHGRLSGCIPLQGLQLQVDDDTSELDVVVLTSVSCPPQFIPYIEYTPLSKEDVTSESHLGPPLASSIHITYYSRIKLQICSDSSNSITPQLSLRRVEEWSDQLERTCWECRASQYRDDSSGEPLQL